MNEKQLVTPIYMVYISKFGWYVQVFIWVYIYILGIHTDSQFRAKGPYVGQPDQFMQDLPLMSSDIDSRRKLYGGAAG